MKASLRTCALALLLGGFGASSRAGTFTANFNDGQVPAGVQVFGNTVVEATGGVGNSGALKITKSINSQSGAAVFEDLDAGATVYGLRVSAMMRVGGGSATPADGWSFSAAPDLPDGAWGEDGAGTGLTIAFDTYDNGGGEAPTVDVRLNNAVVATRPVPIADMLTGADFGAVLINLDADGSLDVVFNGKTFYTNFFLPNFQGITGARYGFGGRTGGLNENVFVDDLSIQTTLVPAIGIASHPASKTVVDGASVTLSVTVNNGDGAAYQWLRDGVEIPAATAASYVFTAAPADDGAKFSARVSKGGVTLTSSEAEISVSTLNLPAAPVLSYNFNDGLQPAGTAVYGTAFIDTVGGVNESGALKLTSAVGGESGTFVTSDPHDGAPVYGFAAALKVRTGGGSTPPADGFSFNFGSDVTEDVVGEAEAGSGTGIRVTFDTYDNGGGEAPAVEVSRGTQLIAQRKVPAGFLGTSETYVDVIIRLTPDGLFDLSWNGDVLLDRVPIPGFTSISGGKFAMHARTGGAFENYWVDDLRIYTYLTAPMRVATQPQSVTALPGRDVTFTVEANDPTGVTYQWFRDNVAIPNATQNVYVLTNATAVLNNAKFKAELRGPNNTATSEEAVLTVLDLTPPATAQINYDFNNGQVPAGASVVGHAFVDAAGGVNDSGVVKLTINENGQNGSFLTPVIEGGAEINGFVAAFHMLAGGGTTPPADGFSFNLGNDLPNSAGEAENGGGTGLTIAFDTYDNGGGEAPSVDVRYKGAVVTAVKVPLALVNDPEFHEVLVRVRDGKVDVAYGDTVVINGLVLTNFTPISGVRAGFFARTGGLNANHFVDNLRIGVSKTTGPTRITRDPASIVVFPGQTATFNVLVNDPQGVTYAWARNGQPIPNATQSSYTTPATTVADDGATYTVTATGAGGSATSAPARLGVLPRFDAGANPPVNVTFDDFALPAGALTFGGAYVDAGGFEGSGVLKLTDAANDQVGTLIMDIPAEAFPMRDFIVTWKMRVGGGTETPADGFSFALASDIGDAAFGEDGNGSGLIVSFDIYDNGGGEAPAIDVLYKGNILPTRKYPISVLRTGEEFVDVGIRVQADGTLDLYYGNTAVHYNLQLPNYEPFTTARFAIGARTGGLNEAQWVDSIKMAFNTGPAAAPEIAIVRNADGSVRITWDGAATLESSATIGGAWQAVNGAASPYTVNTAAGAAQFYRLRQ